MTTNEVDNREEGVPGRPSRLERCRADRVLGGVCSGVARSIGVDPVLVRAAAVLIGLVSAGGAVLAYLLAWVLLPQGTDEPRRPSWSAPPAGGAKQAWTAVGDELKALATELRPKQTSGEAAARAEAAPGSGRRPALRSVDAALTGFGDRLRAPEVHEGARRTLAGLSAAVDASAEELGSKVRRDRS
jgi:phage shock protein PspC (stress-responsive transcriptional regulator)